MINTRRPLEEKVALFWHGVFATAYFKLNQPKAILNQVEMFRRYGMGSFQTLLVQISRDPAMIFWLDNKDNHRDEPNENFGRELLELFSMGVGNYTEQDVFEASRAFTGWTIHNAGLHAARVSRDSVWPFGRLDWQFEYRDEDHDDTETSFLGHTGNFNGEDVIDIICRQEATARFLCRHLYNFFVADEAQVPAWETVPPRDPRAIQTMMDAYFDSGYEVRSVLRVMFNSGFFKDAVFQKIKSPTELIVGTARMAGGYRFPGLEDSDLAVKALYMGQSLLNPPSVEGWHTGVEGYTPAAWWTASTSRWGSSPLRIGRESRPSSTTSAPPETSCLPGSWSTGAWTCWARSRRPELRGTSSWPTPRKVELSSSGLMPATVRLPSA